MVLRFAGSNSHRPHLLAQPGAQMRRHHIDPLAVDPRDNPTDVLGEVEAHPKSPGHVTQQNGCAVGCAQFRRQSPRGRTRSRPRAHARRALGYSLGGMVKVVG